MQKITKDFYITEFVSKNIFDAYGTNSQWFVDRKIFTLAQGVRDIFGKSMTINDWWDDEPNETALPDERKYSGFREPKCTIGGSLSQHRFGRAIDLKISGLTPQEIYAHILKNPKVFMDLGLTTIEDIRDTPTWNHLDIRYTGLSEIKIVRP